MANVGSTIYKYPDCYGHFTVWGEDNGEILTLVFIVDLALHGDISHDKVGYQDIGLNPSIRAFASVASRYSRHTAAIILILNNADVFERDLTRAPMALFDPSYSGGDDTNKAIEYVISRFHSVNYEDLRLYPYVTQQDDLKRLPFLVTALNEIIVQNALQDFWKEC